MFFENFFSRGADRQLPQAGALGLAGNAVELGAGIRRLALRQIP
jgi:hypothetical protein